MLSAAARGVMHLAGQAVADARDRVPVGRVHHLDRGHLVHGQRAGLVGVDGRGEAQRLDRRQVLHDCVALGQVDPAEGQDGLGDRGQRLRDGRDGQRDGGHEQVVPGLAAGPAQHEHHDHREPGGRRDPQREPVELPGQRGFLARRGGQHPGDPAQLGPSPRGRDDHRRAAVRDRAVHERHVGLVTRVEMGTAAPVAGQLSRRPWPRARSRRSAPTHRSAARWPR